MKFRYKRYGSGVIRPVIPLKVAYGNKTIVQEVLVDSGADVCLFDAEVGTSLGIPIERGEPCTFAGMNADLRPAYMHPITIAIGGWEYKLRAGFVPDFAPMYGIVGQIGFFQLFTVKFFNPALVVDDERWLPYKVFLGFWHPYRHNPV